MDQKNGRDESEKLTAAEAADLEARQDGPLPPEARRALRHGAGDRAHQAEAQAQSRFFDDLAKSTVHRQALRRQALQRACSSSSTENDAARDLLSGDLMSYRSDGLLWQARIRD